MQQGLRCTPRRSALYVPVNHARALAKAPSLKTDVLIYDLEDAVLHEQKPKARVDLSRHLDSVTHQAEVIIRINAVNTAAFYEDMVWLESNRQIDGLLLPKVHNTEELCLAKSLLSRIGQEIPVWVLVETVDAVLNLAQIVKQMHKASALVLGAEDLAREMRINPTPGRLGLLPIFTQLVLYGRSAGLTVLDAVFPNLEQELGLKQSCEQARNLGFDGKTLIHPQQIKIANEIFSPSALEVERAGKILAAWNNKPDHLGVITVDGDVIEQLHVKQAQEVLYLAKKCG